MLVSVLGGKQQLDRTAQQYLAQIKSDASNTIQVVPLCSLTCAILLGPWSVHITVHRERASRAHRESKIGQPRVAARNARAV